MPNAKNRKKQRQRKLSKVREFWAFRKARRRGETEAKHSRGETAAGDERQPSPGHERRPLSPFGQPAQHPRDNEQAESSLNVIWNPLEQQSMRVCFAQPPSRAAPMETKWVGAAPRLASPPPPPPQGQPTAPASPPPALPTEAEIVEGCTSLPKDWRQSNTPATKAEATPARSRSPNEGRVRAEV